MKLDHIGIAVRSIEEARGFYETGLGLAAEPGIEEVAGEKVRVLKLVVPPGTHIELLEAMSPDSAVGKFIEKRGPGIHHLCFACDDIAAETKRMVGQGFQPLWPAPKPGAGGCLVNFFHPKETHGVLTELSQPPK
ncbi:MAG: methylmalonyl-CoA epimerase [Planctomycetes bacterium]|nr:methylmalonyl-CoA epimerase [Planctomycetota bacterium]